MQYVVSVISSVEPTQILATSLNCMQGWSLGTLLRYL